MRFVPTPLEGAFVVEIEPRSDERGFFARTVCVDEFAARGIDGRFVQQSVSVNPRRGTLRGLHFQAPPHEEDKLVRVTRGAVFDAIVDLRHGSATFGRHFAIELRADLYNALYIPKGFAHGFQTLMDNTEILYEMTVPYSPGSVRGVRWNDPDIGIEWPLKPDLINVTMISSADLSAPLLADLR